ncbi:2-pyrone-4,6-dicarboxylate hydrolase [Rhizobium deserti]|uniref:2-pyrone-4,6-dicarboxylate hydrolase n=1 Tax=Rhizobium deserti TaxID=2547961 RepID=A0A4R5UB97_9HYPH|nr:amidohydrolase family protein [Rhizobium deserti]TDK32315.1 2-pyrone-4,6-dicarboxylate hydrolase [Rhizobium deserti]
MNDHHDQRLQGTEKRRPEFILPAGSCDAHCHVFGPGNVFPYSASRSYTPEDAPKEALAALHDRVGVERAVIVQASCHGTDNRAMLDAIAWRPDRYRGVAIVDDSLDDRGYQELDDGGVRGVRFNFVRHLGGAPDMAVFNRVIDRIAQRGWHVVLHLDAADIVPLSDMMTRLPVPFVIDHMGRVDTSLGSEQPAFQALLELVRRENCWIKVCGSERISRFPFDAAVPFAQALIKASPERTLWGTDFPHPNLKESVDEADLVDLVPRLAVDEEDRRRLLVENPARLYGFAA